MMKALVINWYGGIFIRLIGIERFKELKILVLRLLIDLDERKISGVDSLIVEIVLTGRGGSHSGEFPMRSNLVHGNKCRVKKEISL
jgi:hypothetical protein